MLPLVAIVPVLVLGSKFRRTRCRTQRTLSIRQEGTSSDCTIGTVYTYSIIPPVVRYTRYSTSTTVKGGSTVFFFRFSILAGCTVWQVSWSKLLRQDWYKMYTYPIEIRA
jgi:hypothetical protein